VSDQTNSDIDDEILSRWQLSAVRPLTGGYHNSHWLVENTAGTELVLRRYKQDPLPDLDYEFAVMHRLARLRWPTPELTQEPLEHAGRTWCLMTKLPGTMGTATDAQEPRQRGRLLAEVHQSSRQLTDLGQRQGFVLSDELACDPDLLTAIKRYEGLKPEEGYILRWHLETAAERLAPLDFNAADQLVLHSDFVARNLLYDDDGKLTGIVDFEATHLNVRVAEFALSWRGRYDDVIHGYEEVERLSDLEWQLLVPVYWSWLFLGIKHRIEALSLADLQLEHFSWQLSQLSRRSKLFGDLQDLYPGRPS
jgi:aminoglycoside phosphotransferase (APT) family kinase protein